MFPPLCVQPIEGLVPEPAITLQPVDGLLEGTCLETAGAPLRLAAACDEPGAFEHLQVLRDGGQAHVERPGELGDGRVAGGEPSEDRAPGGVGEGRDGDLEVSPAPAPKHQAVSGNLFSILHGHVRERGLGSVYYAPIDVLLADTSIVQPDLVFIDAARASIVSRRGIEGPPDLAI